LAAAERAKEEQKRQQKLREIEAAFVTGQARIVRQPDGTFRVVGAELPNGMMDLCVLAKLQERNSAAFRQAMTQAQTQGANFMHQHHLAHLKGGH
jgi:hypothetical protein